MSLSVQQIVDKWSQNLSNAVDNYRNGINAVATSPGTLAAAAADKWQQAVMSQHAKSKFVANSNNTSLADWKTAATTTGVSRLASGAAKGKAKYLKFWNNFKPFLDQVTAQVRAMPSTTLEDRIARMNAQVRGVAQYRPPGA